MAQISLKDQISVSNNGQGLPVDIRQQVDEYTDIFNLYQCYPGMRIYVKYDSTSRAQTYPKGIYIVKSIYSGTGKPNLVEFVEDYLHISNKVNKPSDTPIAGNFVSFDENGNAIDSNCNTESFAPIANAMPLPQQEDEGKILGYEAQTEGANPVVGWVKKPVDGLTPEIDPTTKKWKIGENLTETYAEGKSALQLYNETYNKHLTQEQFVKEIKANYPMAYVGYNSTAAGQSIGTPFESIDDLTASEATMGKMYLMPNASSSPTGSILFVTVQTGETTYRWYNMGDLDVPTNVLTRTNVDNECVDGATDEPASAKAVMDLKAKLEGVTASETKVAVAVGTNVTTGAYVSGETGLLVTPGSSASSYAYFELAIPQGTKSIRFATGTKTSAAKIGYSIGYYNENVYVPTRMFYFDVAETTPPSGIVEKVIEVLEGETTFMATVATVSTYASITLNNFYCYLQNGESVGEALKSVSETLLGYNDDSIVSETDYASVISSGTILANLMGDTEIVRGDSMTKVGGFLISSIGNFTKLRVIGYTSQNRATKIIFTKLNIINLTSPGTYTFEYLSNNGYLCDGANIDNFIQTIPSGYLTPAGIEFDIPKDAVWCFIQNSRILSGSSYSCAPSSVLPFSQHIQGEVEKKIDEKLEDYTPVIVVDSLESDSQTDALSANQGRVLGNYVKRVDRVFFYELATYSITSNGTFGSSTDYRHSIIPVIEGEEYIIENNGTTNNIRYCFIDSTTCEAGGDIPLVEGTSVITVNAGTSQKITIPVGCKYLSFTEDKPSLDNYKVLFYRITYISNKDFFNIVQFGESLPINNTEYHAKWNEIVNDGIATRSEPTYMSWDTNEEYPLYTYKISRQRQWMGSNYSVPPTGYPDYSPLYKRKKIMITAGIHGCERLTPSTLLKWIKEHINDTTFSTFDFVIIPLCNPWGYSHTMIDSQGNTADPSHMSDSSLPSGYSIIANTSTRKFGIRKTRKQNIDTQFIDINRDFNDTDGFITEEAQYVRDVYVAEKPDMVIDLHQDLNSGSQNRKCGFCSLGTSLVYLQDMADIQTKLFSLIDKAGYDTDNYVNRTFVNKQQYTYAWGSKPIDETEYTGEADGGVWKHYASGASSNTLHADCAVRYSFTFETDEFCRKINGSGANNQIAMEYGYLFLSNFLKYIFNVFEMK